MSGGPFRDTLTPLLADTQRQLEELREERQMLEGSLFEMKCELLKNPSGIKRFTNAYLFGIVVGVGAVPILYLLHVVF